MFGKQWSNETMVWVTDLGTRSTTTRVATGSRRSVRRTRRPRFAWTTGCAPVRRACKKCFGEYYGVDSLRVLDRLIEELHGKVDFDQQARTLIATTARLRFGDSNARPPAKGRASTSKRSNSSAYRFE